MKFWDADLTAEQRETLARYEADLEQRLSPYRFRHSVSVAATALELSRLYDDIDPYQAIAAGLLHDWDKELSYEELVAEAERFEVDLPEGEEFHLPLLHSITGPFSLLEVYPELTDSILIAVGRHTIGAVHMSALDMAVYVSDLLEPLRVHPRAEALRMNIGVMPLEELYISSMRSSLIHVVEHERPIFPESVMIWNELMDVLAMSTDLHHPRITPIPKRARRKRFPHEASGLRSKRRSSSRKGNHN